jgi:hypothetical protein
MFLAEIPSGFAGVQDVQPDEDRIVVIERGTGRRLTVQ